MPPNALPVLPASPSAQLSTPMLLTLASPFPAIPSNFGLLYPQTMLGATIPPILAAAETAHKRLKFNAPNKNSAPSPAPAPDALVQALDVAAMDDPGKAALGTASSTDVMSDHTPDCFVLLSAAQIQNLVLCSAAAAAASALSILARLLLALRLLH
jgi:hypothetical protein